VSEHKYDHLLHKPMNASSMTDWICSEHNATDWFKKVQRMSTWPTVRASI
jgi:hypothetical protein